MSVMTKYTEAKKKMKAALEQVNAIVKEAFLEASNEVFNKYPNIESFSWTQYTPYFNDGDECTFSAQTKYPQLTFTDGTEIDINYGKGDADTEVVAKEIAAVKTLLAQVDESDYEEMFGDHVRVVVSRKGAKIEGFDHD
jgi:hypothetical protein